MPDIAINGDRATHLLLTKKLTPLGNLDGDSTKFMQAWVDIVTCHVFLRKSGIAYGDPNLYNSFFNEEKGCGVLTHFDLTVQLSIPSADRTGTGPFMALDLLTENYFKGQLTRRYHHELEALIWMLPFVALGGERPGPTIVKFWKSRFAFGLDARRTDKESFYFNRAAISSSRHLLPSFKNWRIFIDYMVSELRRHHDEAGALLQTLMPAPLDASPVDNFLARQSDERLWTSVTAILQRRPELKQHAERLITHKPKFLEAGDTETLAGLMPKLHVYDPERELMED